jgi:hypothetical protein
MTATVQSERELMREVAQVLLEHLAPNKLARFWVTMQLGQGNYIEWRDAVFGEETVETLCAAVHAYQEQSKDQG